MASRIEDYALIGDRHAAALVDKTGSIDWLCLPRFDSGACFAALLGTREHGRWQVCPAAPIRNVTRQYRDGSTILETTFETDAGAVRVIDFMPLRGEAPDVMRIVEGVRGTVAMRMDLVVRFAYGAVVPWVQKLDDVRGLRMTAGPDTLYVRTTTISLRGEDMATVAEFDVSAGERKSIALTWHPTHLPEPDYDEPETALAHAEAWWNEWSDRCAYDGPDHDAVKRSLITLKALTYAPTGGIVAAPTTSLPEQIGGTRNWDYRYCWLRDATFTLLALSVGGYVEEAGAWRTWLSNAVAGTPSDMQIMYGLAGERRLAEWTVPDLPGYEKSAPVRVGNAAYEQHQLDVYGELMDALYTSRVLGLPHDEETWHIQRKLVDHLETCWAEPDEGIWEIRGPQQQFVHSKVMAWVAFDRAIKTVERFGDDCEGRSDRWRKIRTQIHDEVCARGFDAKLNSFVQAYGSKAADASLLVLPIIGFLPPEDPRIVGTVDYVQRTLMKDGFLLRYPANENGDGLPPGEGVFLLCSFWLADCLAMIGRHDEARELFDRLLALRNDVGLLAEEYDPKAKRMLGNFPQAFSHVGLINTAKRLADTGK